MRTQNGKNRTQNSQTNVNEPIDESMLKVGLHCQLTALGTMIYHITEINPDQLMPIGVAPLGHARATFYVRPIAIRQLIIPGHTNN